MEVITLESVANSLPGPWQPREIAAVNDSVVRMAKVHGEFPWHHHNEDELFLAFRGEFTLETESHGNFSLRPGQCILVPAGTRHRPVAREEAVVLLFELQKTKQYGEPA